MARKDVLRGLLGATDSPPAPTPAADTPPAAPPGAPPPRATRGAIGAVSRSIADLKSRAVIEIDPHLIDAGGVQDRLETDEGEDADLRRSIAEYGQQVPVLVRPHPTSEGRFQIVYGRRRVLALRDLGQPVKALVRDLDDRELVLAQGQENTARRDLSFIEKVNFARQMAEAGYDRKVIGDALSVDKTLISRMMSVAERIPAGVIAAIGSAHGIGRDRWLDFAQLIETSDVDEDWLLAMLAAAQETTGEGRFAFLLDRLSRRQAAVAAPAPVAGTQPGLPGGAPFPAVPSALLPPEGRPAAPAATLPLRAADGAPLGEVRATRKALVLQLSRDAAPGFADWLVDELPRLHATWRAGRQD